MWAGELGVAESADPVNAISNGTLLLSTAHARRLQAAYSAPNTEGESIFPVLNLGALFEAIVELTGIYSMVTTTLYDIAAHAKTATL